MIETVPTRFLQYRPGYNEIDQSPTWYDASVLYVDARDEGGGIAVIEDQELVDSGAEVQIVALQNEFRRSGTGRVTLEFRPAENVTETLPDGNLTVTLPTRLSENDWETKTDLPTDSNVYGGITDDANDDGVYNLTLNTSTNDLTVDTVGVQETPDDPVQNANGAVGGDGGSGDGGTGGGSDNADSVQTVDGTGSTTGNGDSGKLVFEVTTDAAINIDAAAIETTGGLSSVGAKSKSKFVIDKKSSTKGSSTDGSFDYVFNPSVTVQSGVETEIEFNSLDTGIKNIGIVDSESNADIIVSLRFDDGSVKRIFFEADER